MLPFRPPPPPPDASVNDASGLTVRTRIRNSTVAFRLPAKEDLMPHRRSRLFGTSRKNSDDGRNRIAFRDHLPTLPLEVCVEHEPWGNEKYHPIPQEAPPGVPFRLEDVLGESSLKSIRENGVLVFHAAGDTGGIKRPESQRIVADKMEEDFRRADRSSPPSFFYIIGDVVYYHGEPAEYYPQFYEPYLHYPAPIFAIPGNHDGDPNPRNPESRSLDGFLENFCAPAPVLTPDAGDANRTAMTQPNPYWVLDGPWLRIVGLYTNVPEGGEVREKQKE